MAQVDRGLDAPIPHSSHTPSPTPPASGSFVPMLEVAVLAPSPSLLAESVQMPVPCGHVSEVTTGQVQAHEGMRMGGGFLLMNHRTRNEK